jgi:hypothetical protein
MSGAGWGRVAEMQRRHGNCIGGREIFHFVVFDIAVSVSAQALAIMISHFAPG